MGIRVVLGNYEDFFDQENRNPWIERVVIRAVDPDSLNSDQDTDPDPAFQVNPDSDKDPRFWWPKTEEKKI